MENYSAKIMDGAEGFGVVALYIAAPYLRAPCLIPVWEHEMLSSRIHALNHQLQQLPSIHVHLLVID